MANRWIQGLPEGMLLGPNLSGKVLVVLDDSYGVMCAIEATQDDLRAAVRRIVLDGPSSAADVSFARTMGVMK